MISFVLRFCSVRDTNDSFAFQVRQLQELLVVDESTESIIYGICFDEESTEQITRLFKIIDKNSDGKLSVEDFQFEDQVSGNIGPLTSKWREVTRWQCVLT